MSKLIIKIVLVLALVAGGVWFAVSTYTDHPDFFWYGFANGFLVIAIVVRIPHAWQNPDRLRFPWDPTGLNGYQFLLRLYGSILGKVVVLLLYVWLTWSIVGINYWAWLGGFCLQIILSVALGVLVEVLNRFFPRPPAP